MIIIVWVYDLLNFAYDLKDKDFYWNKLHTIKYNFQYNIDNFY